MSISANIKRVASEDMAKQKIYTENIKSQIKDRDYYFYIESYGCQQNESDSEKIAGMACEMGYKIVNEPSSADVIIINTCAVREHAELKTLSIVGQFKHIKEKNKNLIIGLSGCMVSQEHRSSDIKNKYPYVDFVFGTSMLYRFPEILYNTITSEKRRFWLNEDDGSIAEDIPVKRSSLHKAWVSVMYGCNNFCSYCVVPYVRGRERSRISSYILEEIKTLVRDNYYDITLLGQNVNSYGQDLDKNYGFTELLYDICKIEGEFKIRFMTSHPKDVPYKLIDFISENEKMAKHIHLPVQSGSNRVLHEMNRKYTREDYIGKIEYLKNKIPDISLTSDIIVGFPGETEEDFLDTLDILEKIKFDSVYSFIYSKRKGTPAADMKNQVPDETKKERFSRLMQTQNKISYENNQKYINKIIEVTVDEISKTNGEKLTGRDDKGKVVHFSGNGEIIGKRLNILINRAEAYALYGDIQL